MRAIPLFLAVTCAATSAFAQTATTGTTTQEIGYGGRTGTATTTTTGVVGAGAAGGIPTAAIPGTTAPASFSQRRAMASGAAVPINQPGAGGPVVTNVGAPAAAPTEIGFDAKVKRDPNGKVIDENKAAAPVQAAAPELRNDHKLRSDSAILTKKPEPTPQPTTPAQQPNQQNNNTNGATVANSNVIGNNSSVPKLVSSPTTRNTTTTNR